MYINTKTVSTGGFMTIGLLLPFMQHMMCGKAKLEKSILLYTAGPKKKSLYIILNRFHTFYKAQTSFESKLQVIIL